MTSATLPLSEVKRALSRVTRYTSTDKARLALQCVLIQRTAGALIFAAADGFRMCVMTLPAPAPLGVMPGEWSAPINAADLKAVMNLKGARGSMLHIDLWECGTREYEQTSRTSQGRNRDKVETQTIECRNYGVDFGPVHTTAEDVTYPDYRCIIPTRSLFEFMVPAGIAKATEAMRVAAKAFDSTHLVSWYMDYKGHTFITESEESGDSRYTVEDAQEIPTFGIAFNSNYLADVFKYCDTGAISAHMGRQNGPALFLVDDDTEIVLMPMSKDTVTGMGATPPEPITPESKSVPPIAWKKEYSEYYHNEQAKDDTSQYNRAMPEPATPAPDAVETVIAGAEYRDSEFEASNGKTYHTPMIVLNLKKAGGE